MISCLLSFAANAMDGDKESECDEDGPSPEDSRKVNMISTFVKKRNVTCKLFAYIAFDLVGCKKTIIYSYL